MNGIELACRFSYIVNNLRYCGPPEAKDLFLQYFKNKDNEQEVADVLKRFEGTNPYFSAIAKKHGKEILDFDVVEAYWIGNELLDIFDNNDMKLIIESLVKRGLPESLGKKLADELPDGMLPQHVFNVFYVGVGQLTGAVPTNLDNMNNCRASWGEVLEVKDDNLVISSPQVEFKDGKYVMGNPIEKTSSFIKELMPNIKSGDIVALHWGFAPLILTDKQLQNLTKYTLKILDVLNRA